MTGIPVSQLRVPPCLQHGRTGRELSSNPPVVCTRPRLLAAVSFRSAVAQAEGACVVRAGRRGRTLVRAATGGVTRASVTRNDVPAVGSPPVGA